MEITSGAFTEGKPIPQEYTCDGADISPPLDWTDVPPDAKSLALIADDPDAPGGTWVHWVLYNLPPDIAGLEENVPVDAQLVNGASQGINDFKRTGYGGPCPPPGKPHRYYFKIYALDSMLDVVDGATKQALLDAMDGHVLGEGHLMGTYRRN